jgi:ABC-type sugar transport system substrate-binding protein
MSMKRTLGRLALALATAGLMTSGLADITVAYITNSNTNEGWTLINGGAKKAGQKPGIKFIQLAVEQGELSKQPAIVEDIITHKVNAMAIAPINSAGITTAINKVLAAGIVAVAVDTNSTGVKITSHVAADNLKAASVQGEWRAEQIKDNDTVICLTGELGQSTGQERKKGLLDRLNAKCKNAKVVEVPTTWNQTIAQNGIETAKHASPGAKVIACAWDAGALGAKAAMMAAGKKAGSIKIAGVNGSPGGLNMTKQGWQQANAAQMLTKISQVGVETAITAAVGKKVETRLDTGSFLVLPSHLDPFAKDSGVVQFMRAK